MWWLVCYNFIGMPPYTNLICFIVGEKMATFTFVTQWRVHQPNQIFLNSSISEPNCSLTKQFMHRGTTEFRVHHILLTYRLLISFCYTRYTQDIYRVSCSQHSLIHLLFVHRCWKTFGNYWQKTNSDINNSNKTLHTYKVLLCVRHTKKCFTIVTLFN